MRNNGLILVVTALILCVVVACDELKLGASYVGSIIKVYVHSAFVDDLDEEPITQVPVEYAGDVGLDLKGTVNLAFDTNTPGIGKVTWMGITAENSVFVVDGVTGEVHEFSLDNGSFIRSFGRRGKGPGEYGGARAIAMDDSGSVFVQDKIRGQLLRYDRQGRYLGDRMRWIANAGLLINRDDALFLLESNHRRLLQIRRITGINGIVVYTLPLFSNRHRLLNSLISDPAQICYNAALDQIYFVEANDYIVKEIDAGTGEISRKFGALVPRIDISTLEKQASDFRFLPKKYRSQSARLNPHEAMGILSQVSITNSMTLIDDRYLMVSHLSPNIANVWTLYDLKTSQPTGSIRAYSLDVSAYKSLNGVEYNSLGDVVIENSIDGRITSWNDRLYVYKPVLQETAESSNGTVEMYGLSFD